MSAREYNAVMPATRTFPKSRRLSGKDAFTRVFDARRRASRGAITIYAAANSLEFSRMGISIGRPVGSAVVRNRIKRLLREAFRLSHDELPKGYDWVIVVRRHAPMPLGEYQSILKSLTGKLC